MADHGVLTRFCGVGINQLIYTCMASKEVTTNELYEIMEFMKDNMLTKEDGRLFATKDDIFEIHEELRDIRSEMATKKELHEVENRLIDHIEGLARCYNRHDSEIAALNSRCGRIERHVGMS
jgi:hypothetical protein